MSFTFLDHTADLQVECRGESFKSLLETAAKALYAATLHKYPKQASAQKDISLSAHSREELLVRWLQELIYLLEAEHFVAMEFEFRKVDECNLEVSLHGNTCMPEERAEEIKSATYHELSIKEENGAYTARIMFDL